MLRLYKKMKQKNFGEVFGYYCKDNYLCNCKNVQLFIFVLLLCKKVHKYFM